MKQIFRYMTPLVFVLASSASGCAENKVEMGHGDEVAEATAELCSAAEATGPDAAGEMLFRGLFLNNGPAAAAFHPGERPPVEVAGTAQDAAKQLDDALDVERSGEAGDSFDAEEKAALSPLVERIAQAKNRRASANQAEKVLDRILGAMRSTKPEFFTDFYAKMTSGNPLLVREAVNGAGRLLTSTTGALSSEASASEESENLGGLKPSDTCIECGGMAWFVNVDSVLNVVSAVNVEAVVNIRYAVNIDTVKNKVHAFDKPMAGARGLAIDTLSADLAEQFGHCQPHR